MEFEKASNEHINRYKMAHMIGVAEYMRERAVDYQLDPDKMYVVGLLHDIGYLQGRQEHEAYGSFLLSSIITDENLLCAIANHGRNLKAIESVYGKEVITSEFALLMEADASVDARGFRVGFSGRLKDVANRYGKDHPAYLNMKDNIDYIKEYQKEHGIGKPVDHKRANALIVHKRANALIVHKRANALIVGFNKKNNRERDER